MSRYVTIPREALADLLQALGSPLTPEQYLATLPPPGPDFPGAAPTADLSAFRRYPSRALAAVMSKYCLLAVAIFGVLLYPFLGSYIENGIIVVGLITVTYFEYRVHTYFRENNPKAPELGFRNQSLFALAIVIYCLYHAFMPASLSHDTMQLVESSNIDVSMLNSFVRGFYLFIAALAGGSQFWLACYYRRAQIAPDPSAAPPPFNG